MIDAAQGSGQVFYGITFDSTFDASAQTTTVQNGLKMYAGPYGGNGGNCCNDGKSAAFKNHTYFCKDPNDWLPDKTYTFSGGARPHAPSGLNLLHLLPRIPRMKTSPRLGAATESRMQSRRWFRAREPKSLVAAAPRKSPRAGKTQHQHHLLHHKLLPHPNSSPTRTTAPRDSRASS